MEVLVKANEALVVSPETKILLTFTNTITTSIMVPPEAKAKGSSCSLVRAAFSYLHLGHVGSSCEAGRAEVSRVEFRLERARNESIQGMVGTLNAFFFGISYGVSSYFSLFFFPCY